MAVGVVDSAELLAAFDKDGDGKVDGKELLQVPTMAIYLRRTADCPTDVCVVTTVLCVVTAR